MCAGTSRASAEGTPRAHGTSALGVHVAQKDAASWRLFVEGSFFLNAAETITWGHELSYATRRDLLAQRVAMRDDAHTPIVIVDTLPLDARAAHALAMGSSYEAVRLVGKVSERSHLYVALEAPIAHALNTHLAKTTSHRDFTTALTHRAEDHADLLAALIDYTADSGVGTWHVRHIDHSARRWMVWLELRDRDAVVRGGVRAEWIAAHERSARRAHSLWPVCAIVTALLMLVGVVGWRCWRHRVHRGMHTSLERRCPGCGTSVEHAPCARCTRTPGSSLARMSVLEEVVVRCRVVQAHHVDRIIGLRMIAWIKRGFRRDHASSFATSSYMRDVQEVVEMARHL